MVQRLSDMTAQFKDVRRQMEEDEDLATLMRGLRGQNLNDELFASGQEHPATSDTFWLSLACGMRVGPSLHRSSGAWWTLYDQVGAPCHDALALRYGCCILSRILAVMTLQ